VVVFALVLGLWTYASDHLIDPSSRFLLPSPLEVLKVGVLDWHNLGEILSALWKTTSVALTGLAISMVIGVALGILMSQARWVEYSVYPYAVALQTIPILAMVPLFGFWFGFDFQSRVIVCVLVPLFPIITNTLFGMKSVEPGLHDLFSLYAANRVKRLLFLQLPAALPAILTGFRISRGTSGDRRDHRRFLLSPGRPRDRTAHRRLPAEPADRAAPDLAAHVLPRRPGPVLEPRSPREPHRPPPQSPLTPAPRTLSPERTRHAHVPSRAGPAARRDRCREYRLLVLRLI
jgi:ABC-type nitrate/sulfonate/bicarbonate transport system permease component